MDIDSVQNATNRIFQLICKSSSLQDMIDLGAELLDTDISFFDINIDFMAVSNIKSHRLNDITYIQNQNQFISKIEIAEDNTPFIIYVEESKKLLISKSYYAGNYMGHIAIPESDIPLEELNYEIIKLISDACAISFILMDNKPVFNNCLETETAVFEELLYGKYKTLSDFNSDSKCFSFKDYNKFSTICFIVEEKRHKMIQKEILNAIKNIKCGFWATSYNDNVAAMIGWNTNKLNIKEIINKIEKICIDNDIIIGIGDPFTHIMQTRQNYTNAERATIYGHNDDSKRKLFYYDDYKFNVFISDMNLYINNSLDYLSFKVMDILKHDQKYNTEYATTLKIFLSTSLSPQATADILYIHKNTVIYRINKIKELFDIDFANTTQNFQLYFSFQLLVVRGWVKAE